MDIVVESRDMAVLGLWGVLKRYAFLRGVFNRMVRLARERKPDAVLLVDYPGFNLRFAAEMKKLGHDVTILSGVDNPEFYTEALHQSGDFRLGAGIGIVKGPTAAPLVKGDTPTVAMGAGLAAALHQPGEAEADIGGHVGAHPEQLAHDRTPVQLQRGPDAGDQRDSAMPRARRM